MQRCVCTYLASSFPLLIPPHLNPLLARYISTIVHPLLIPSYIFGVLLFVDPTLIASEVAQRWLIMGFIALATILFPLLGYLILYSRSPNGRFSVLDPVDRLQWMILVIAYYAVFAVLISMKLGFDHLVALVSIVMVGVLVVACALSYAGQFHISLRAMGLSCGLGVFYAASQLFNSILLTWPSMAFVLLLGLAMSARLALGVRSEREVYFGAVTGFVLGYVGMNAVYTLLGA